MQFFVYNSHKEMSVIKITYKTLLIFRMEGLKMKYKILILGNDESTADGFFYQLSDSLDAFSTSFRYDDIIRHIEIVEPDMVVYCMGDNEAINNINQMNEIKKKYAVPIVIIGTSDACENFEKIAPKVASLTFRHPVDSQTLGNKICEFLSIFVTAKPIPAKTASTVSSKAEQKPILSEDVDFSKIPAINAAIKKSPAENTSSTLNAEASKNQISQSKTTPMNKLDLSSNRKHILIIDDDTIMLKIIKEHLRDDYNVATASGGKLAYKFLESKNTDLILLDYSMPDEDGPAVFENIRNIPKCENTPIIFLTGVNDRNMIQRALCLEPQGYLLKPISKDKLLNTIKNIL